MHKTFLDGLQVYTIDDFLTPAECAAFIEQFRNRTFEKGTIGDLHLIESFRNNDRVIHDDHALAAAIFERAREDLPAEWQGRELGGFNERWRYYRYLPGQYFKMHGDGAHHRFQERERSLLTFMIYLNDVEEGGETRFYDRADPRVPYLAVKPKCGTALVFLHQLLHEGAEVLRGEKHVLRTDVMFRMFPKKTAE